MGSPIRLGCRGSALAVKQAEIVKAKLQACYPDTDIVIKTLHTRGDMDKVTPLSSLGGKGVFIKEIEQALLNGDIDIAVHSLKDMTSVSPDELCLSGFLKAESNRDVLVLKERSRDLPEKAVIGTGSMRRIALLKQLYPDWQLNPVRGNVETRIRKVDDGLLDGVVLSEAGLIRLGLTSRISRAFDPEHFLPAPGQGVIVLQTRCEDTKNVAAAAAINDPSQEKLSRIEMAFLLAAGLNCSAPLGGSASLKNGVLSLTAFVTDPHYRSYYRDTVTLPLTNPIPEATRFGQKFGDFYKAHSVSP